MNKLVKPEPNGLTKLSMAIDTAERLLRTIPSSNMANCRLQIEVNGVVCDIYYNVQKKHIMLTYDTFSSIPETKILNNWNAIIRVPAAKYVVDLIKRAKELEPVLHEAAKLQALEISHYVDAHPFF
jgi:hypothetical protein